MEVSLREWLGDCAGPNGGEDWFAQTDLKINQLLDKIAKLEALINRPQAANFYFTKSFYVLGERCDGGGATDNMYAPTLKHDNSDGDNSIRYIGAIGGDGISQSLYIPVNCTLVRAVVAHTGIHNTAINPTPPYISLRRGNYSMPGMNNISQASEVARIFQQVTSLNIPFSRGQIFWILPWGTFRAHNIAGDYIPPGGWFTCIFKTTEAL